jgi:hypothetical protein
VDRHGTTLVHRARWGLALVPLVLALALAGCSAGGGGSTAQGDRASATTTPQQANATLVRAGRTVQAAMTRYRAAVGGCAEKSSPVVCLEAADRTLGDEIHAYANLLARHQPGTAPPSGLHTALNAAQTLANSLEILGDAQPTHLQRQRGHHPAAGRRRLAQRIARHLSAGYRRTVASSP